MTLEPAILARGPQILIVRRDDWHAFYEKGKQEIERVAGTLLPALEHVGSTAVPGLAGKPVIDVLSGAQTLADGALIAEKLRAIGYAQIPFRPSTQATSPDRLFFLKRSSGTQEGVELSRPGFNIHVVPIDRFWQDDQLLLRDFLRTRPDVAAEYARIKCEVVGRISAYAEYTLAKSEFVERALEAARGGVSIAPDRGQPRPDP